MAENDIGNRGSEQRKKVVADYLSKTGGRFSEATLRDWFAGMALSGLMARHPTERHTARVYACDAYLLADAMIQAREFSACTRDRITEEDTEALADG